MRNFLSSSADDCVLDSSSQQTHGFPIARWFFARCGMPPIQTGSYRFAMGNSGSGFVVSHISRKTSEIWGTHGLVVRPEIKETKRLH
jgi:hypothetical protein